MINMQRNRTVSSLAFCLIYILASSLLHNFIAYQYIINHSSGSAFVVLLTLLTWFSLIFLLNSLLFILLCIVSSLAAKILACILSLINSVALFFLVKFSVIIDRGMIGNILNTSFEESGEFIGIDFAVFFLGLGVAPCILILKLKIIDTSKVKMAIIAVAITFSGVSSIYLNASTWLWFDKHAKYLGGLTLPWSILSILSDSLIKKKKNLS